jgi:predicted RecA/RadA family phage recombinase
MKNYIQEGKVLTVKAPYAVKSGEGFLLEDLFLVATADAELDAEVEGMTMGVVELEKASGAIDAGKKVYWDATAKKITGTAAGNSLVGVAVKGAVIADPVVLVRLDGVSVTHIAD